MRVNDKVRTVWGYSGRVVAIYSDAPSTWNGQTWARVRHDDGSEAEYRPGELAVQE